jgi:glycosyltransferase involved in cell wall biosynthesis
MPQVSVIIPTYNRANLISKAIDSVLAQTFTDYEIIVVDDGSNDDTQVVLTKYQDKLRVIAQENKGEGEARNTGIRSAKGDYLAFLDSDDLWFPNKLAEQMEKLKHSPETLWSFCDAYYFNDSNGNILFSFSAIASPFEGFIHRRLLLCDFIPSPTVVIHRSIFSKVGYFSTAPIAADWDMWLRIASKFPIARIPKPLAGYRIHENMISNRDPMIIYNYYLATIDRAIAFAPDIYGPWRDKAIAQTSIRIGRALANIGQVQKARRMFFQAIKLNHCAWDAFIYWLSCLIPYSYLRIFIQLRKYFLKSILTNSGNIAEFIRIY